MAAWRVAKYTVQNITANPGPAFRVWQEEKEKESALAVWQ